MATLESFSVNTLESKARWRMTRMSCNLVNSNQIYRGYDNLNI